jgi:hypothetical protein
MTSYEFNLAGAGNVKKSGETQPRPAGSEGSNPGGSGAVTAVVGGSTPVVVATGAENNG